MCVPGTDSAQHAVGVQVVAGEQRDRLARVQAPGSPSLTCPLDTGPFTAPAWQPGKDPVPS